MTTSTNSVAVAASSAERSPLLPLVLAAFLVVLNETILNVALSSIMRDLDVSAGQAQWASSVYMLTMACVIPASGFLLRRLGTRTLFLTAMVTFSVGTLCAALAPAFAVLVTARVIQALGAAVMMPVVLTTVAATVAENRRGSVMGLVSIVVGAAPAIGPTISGFGIHLVSWHGLFWVTLILGTFSLLLGLRSIPRTSARSTEPFDPWSAALSVIAFGGLVLALTFAEHGGSTVTLGIALVAGSALVVFALRQGRRARTGRPYLDLRTFTRPRFALAMVAIAAVGAALFSTLSLTPLLLQNILGSSALTTGLAMLPGGALIALLSPLTGRLADRFGAARVMIPAAVLAAAALFGYRTFLPAGGVIAVAMLFALFHVALAGLITPLMTEAVGSVHAAMQSDASATFTTVQQLCGAAGTAGLVGLMQAVTGSGDGISITGMQAAFTVSGSLMIAPLLVGVALVFLSPKV